VFSVNWNLRPKKNLIVQYFFVSYSIALRFKGLAVIFKVEDNVKWLVYTRGSTATRIHYFGSVFGDLSVSRPCRFTSAGERPRQKSGIGWKGPEAGLDVLEEREIYFPTLGVEPRFLGRPDHSQISLRKIHGKCGSVYFI
jgi:hypothetical protein